MNIEYKYNHQITAEQFLSLLQTSTLAERRPVDNLDCIQGMLDNTNLTYSAWLDGKLVGIARCITDFHYCCYLSDLAVDQSLQHSGIGKTLINLCANKTESTCKLILLSSPAANTYYQKIGMTHMERCWIISPSETLT